MTEAFSDFVVGHGELWCARLLHATLAKSGCPVAFMDTRDVLVVTPTADGNSVDVDYATSGARLDAWARAHGAPAVRPRLFWQLGLLRAWARAHGAPAVRARFGSVHAPQQLSWEGFCQGYLRGRVFRFFKFTSSGLSFMI